MSAHDAGSPPPTDPAVAAAELSSAATDLEALVRRVSGVAEALADSGYEVAANDLFEVERSLGAASRRLAQTVRELRP
jgi:hypothetical protein